MMQPTIIDVTDLCRSLSLVMAGILTACSEKHASMNRTREKILQPKASLKMKRLEAGFVFV